MDHEQKYYKADLFMPMLLRRFTLIRWEMVVLLYELTLQELSHIKQTGV